MYGMNDIVSTNTLFTTTKDWSKLNDKERQEYIMVLANEFMEKADVLMRSLKDK